MASAAAGGGGGSGGSEASDPLGLSGPVATAAVPTVVTLLAGNPATAACVLGCLDAGDASTLRRVHPAIAAAVAEVPWADLTTVVWDARRWRAALPAAVGGTLARLAGPACDLGALLAGVTDLDLGSCGDVNDDVVSHLPPTLRSLNLAGCAALDGSASFTHLPALTLLDCSHTRALVDDGLRSISPSLRLLRLEACTLPPAADFSHLRSLQVLHCTSVMLDRGAVASLPPSLQELYVSFLPRRASLAHLVRLRVLHAAGSGADDAMVATLAPSLNELEVSCCDSITAAASFAHLCNLVSLTVRGTHISDAALATMPPLLVALGASGCAQLTPAATLPPLPALRVLRLSRSRVSDALVASLPPGLEELYLAECGHVTAAARFDHLTSLRLLQTSGTPVSPAALAACRARGCLAPADGVLCRDRITCVVRAPSGQVFGYDARGRLLQWDEARAGCDAMVLNLQPVGADCMVHAIAVLPDGYTVCTSSGSRGGITVWDTGALPLAGAAHRDPSPVLFCGNHIGVLAVLRDGRLAAAGVDTRVLVVDVDAGVVAASLEGHTDGVSALAVLPRGVLASGSADKTLRLWDVTSRACVATLVGHSEGVTSLVSLPGGRLASGSWDTSVRLWDPGSRTCVGVLAGHAASVMSLAVLTDGRLVSGAWDGLRVWNVPSAGGASSPALAFSSVCDQHADGVTALLPLPGARLAIMSSEGIIRLWQLPPPPPLPS